MENNEKEKNGIREIKEQVYSMEMNEEEKIILEK